MTPAEGKIIDEYQFENKSLLGKGSFGAVYKGVDTKRNRPIAVKVIPSSSFENSPDMMKMLKAEIGNMTKISTECENIVKLYDVKRSKSNLYMILEFCEDGSLEDYIKRNKGRLSEVETNKIIKQVLRAFKTLHKYHIAHRDLKLQNILMHKGVVKVADFGFSKMYNDQSLMMSLVGSPLYTAPQILFGQQYSDKCDIWSLAVMMFEMIFHSFPWIANTPPDLAKKIRSTPLRIPETPPTSPEMKTLLTRMLTLDESARISWDELFNHPFYDENAHIKEINALNNEQDELRKSIGFLKMNAQNNLQVYDAAEMRRIHNPSEPKTPTQYQSNEINLDGKPSDHGVGKFAQDIADQIRKDEEIKVEFKKYGNRIAFERNILKYLTRYFIYDLYVYANQMNMKPDLYYRIMFTVGKHYMIMVNWLKETLEGQINAFKFPMWPQFIQTKDYQDFVLGIRQEYTSFYDFFRTFHQKTRDFLASPAAAGLDPMLWKQFQLILNENFKPDPLLEEMMGAAFTEFFHLVKEMWGYYCNDKKFLLLVEIMLVVLSRGIYQFFVLDEYNRFDFFKFREDCEGKNIDTLRADIWAQLTPY